MKIITLTDNTTLQNQLIAEHGLSVYIETDKHRILFDTGKSDVFIHNANTLHIDLKNVDTVVISHGHYDHLGGLIAFLELNNKARVYLKKEIFDYQYLSVRNKTSKPIGYPEELRKFADRFIYVDKKMIELDEMIFFGEIDHYYPLPKGNKWLYKTNNVVKTSDDFRHELIFALNICSELYIFTGCAHNGALNMLKTVKNQFPNHNIKMIFGGLHLIDENEYVETETADEIAFIGNEINNIAPKIELITGHCTGKNAMEEIGKTMKNRFLSFYSGYQIEF